MSRDEITEMARLACDPDKVDAWRNGFWTLTQEELERFAALVAAAECEACASLLEDYERFGDTRDCAAAIRARETK
jgi:hypothetical protein